MNFNLLHRKDRQWKQVNLKVKIEKGIIEGKCLGEGPKEVKVCAFLKAEIEIR
jgi:hypothetical protein